MLNAELIQSELTNNESLLWSGQPERSVIFHKEDILTIPFSLMWGGFAIAWEMAVLGFNFRGGGFNPHDTPWFFMAWGIPFVLIGQYLIWGRFVHAYWTKARTFYAVTSKRILICTMRRRGKSVSSMELANIGAVEKSLRSSGIGTLKFAYLQSAQIGSFRLVFGSRRNANLSYSLTKDGAPAFVDILDAEMVYRIIMEAKEKQSAEQTKGTMFGFSSGK